MRPVEVFVSARGNAFMTDIAHWIAEAATIAGRRASVVDDRLPGDDDAIHLVVAPHELFALAEASDRELRAAIERSVPVCTEQPGTPWFNLTAELVKPAMAALDINVHGVGALRERGIDARHLRLGGVPSMQAPASDRDIELLFLGGATGRRAAELAALGPVLWDRDVELRLFRFSKPIHGAVPGTVFGRDKYELLARSRVLLNIHRDDVRPGYFEWARMVEAMANGCAVLTEPSTGHEPLQAGVHFVASDDLAADALALLDDPDRCRSIGAAARRAVLDEHPLAASLAPVLDGLDGLAPPARPRRRLTRERPLPRAHKPPLLPEFRPLDATRRELYVAWLAEQRLLRDIEHARCVALHGADDVIVRTETPAYAAARPEVSVVVTLYGYADLVVETLESIVASHDVDIEIVVIDDHSRDAGRAVVQAFMDIHPEVPMRLLGSEVNRGLSASRNVAVAEARADLVMVMDADNLVYPSCLRVLADTLHADPGAAFAYATLEAFGSDPGLRSELPWFVPWLCEANYIDAQAMVRRATFEEHGAYRDFDEFAYGWEDWDLWLRLAAAGARGAHVPRMLGRYRTQPASMVTITNLVAHEMVANLRRLHPTLPWP